MLSDLGALCWACRLVEARAQFDWPGDTAVVAVAADAFPPQQKENLSDV